MDWSNDFAWDERKAASNEAKHGVPFDYATRIFLDDSRVDFDVSRAFEKEDRRKVVGKIEGRLYCVVYTMRAKTCRIISARRANAKERRAYG